MKYCMYCGAKIADDALFCGACGKKQTSLENENVRDVKVEAKTDPYTIDLNNVSSASSFDSTTYSAKSSQRTKTAGAEFIDDGLSSYYKDRFERIRESGETDIGGWNWSAFIFGAIWALTKGLWLSVLLCVVLTALSGGILGVVYWFIYGFRGNYMYYRLKEYGKQTVF